MSAIIYIITAFFAFVSGYLTGKTNIRTEDGTPPTQNASCAADTPAPDAEQAAFECLLRYNAETAYGQTAKEGKWTE